MPERYTPTAEEPLPLEVSILRYLTENWAEKLDNIDRIVLASGLSVALAARDAQVRAEALRDAADIVHAEARWQWELHTRQSVGAQIVAQRMLVVEETIRGMADRIADTTHTNGGKR